MSHNLILIRHPLSTLRAIASAHVDMKEVNPLTVDLEPQRSASEINNDFALYLAEIPFSGRVLGKVGMVETPDGLANRMDKLKGPAQLFFPEIYAGFKVSPNPNVAPKSIETSIHKRLTNRGLVKISEIFPAPEASMRRLLAEMESAMKEEGLDYEPIDVTGIAADFKGRNLATQGLLAGKRDHEVPCPYEIWRGQQSAGMHASVSQISLGQEADLRDQTAVGFIVHDLGMGCSKVVRMDLGDFGAMTIHPASSLEEGLFEARAEQHLLLPTTTRCTVRAALAKLPEIRPFAIRIFIRESLTMVEIPGPLMNCEGCQGDELRFSPGHLACLGELTASPGQTWEYFGCGTRAPLSPPAFNLARQDPSLLPALRFWAGTEQALDRGIHIQDYSLPLLRRDYETKLRNAATALHSIGHHIPEALVEWVCNVWLSAA